MDSQLKDYLDQAVVIARKAGNMMATAYHSVPTDFEIKSGNPADLVTEVDIKAGFILVLCIYIYIYFIIVIGLSLF